MAPREWFLRSTTSFVRNRNQDVESGSLLQPSRSLHMAEVYFPELAEREKVQCRALGLLHPDGPACRAWHVLMLLLTFWSAFWVPFEFGFLPTPPVGVMYADAVVDLFFLLDMLLVFNTAFRCHITFRLTTKRTGIAKRYLSRGFFPDLFSSIPYNLLNFWAKGVPIGGALGTFVRFLACMRLYRLPRVYSAVGVVGRKSYTLFLVVRLSKLMFNIVLASHYAAVLYFWITTLEPNPEAVWIVDPLGPEWQTQPVVLQYVATMWWSVFVITSIGPAYVSTTTPEQIFSCFYALFGLSALSYTLGTLTVLMVKASSSTLEYHEDLEALRMFAVRNSLPLELEQQLREQLHLRLLQRKSETESFLANLPQHLRDTISRHLHLAFVQGLPDFEGCSKAFLNQLVAACETEVVLRNATVTVAGDVATPLFVVMTGKLVREGEPHLSPERATILPGSVFGKTAVLRDVPQPFTVRAVETSQLLRLSRSAFKAIMAAYPADAEIITSRLEQKLAKSESQQVLDDREASLPAPTLSPFK